MNILGLSFYYHDSAAALIKDGVVDSAVLEERFSRIKHDLSFPEKSIQFALKHAGITARELDFVVFYEKPFRKFHRILETVRTNYPKSAPVFREAIRNWFVDKLWVKTEIAHRLNIPSEKILFTEHHMSHAGSCFFPSPFDKAAIMTVDGVGEWTTASWGVGIGNNIEIKEELSFPDSVGLLYSAFTAFLGFTVNEGEGKVMGLAPYGKPTYVDEIWKIVKLYKDGSISLDMSYFDYQYSPTRTFSNKFIATFGEPISPKNAKFTTQKNADIAASIQYVLDEIMVSMAKYVKKKSKMENLCLAGGVMLNSTANFAILKHSGFKNIWIQPAAGDGGAAIGAALFVYHQVLGNTTRFPIEHMYLGKEYSNQSIKQWLNETGIKAVKLSDHNIIDRTVSYLSKDKVVGWFQGRFEFGPRALGGRSILANPAPWYMKDVINARIKYREGFRPFAPSALSKYSEQCFDFPKNPDSHHPFRYMLYVTPVKKKWQSKVAAINHIDDTARVQLVYKDTSPLYYDLIKKFYEKTGIPMVLNTSYNLKDEPIVDSPADAYKTFMRSGMDALVLGNYWVEKK
jgi:carbamoyltransferase